MVILAFTTLSLAWLSPLACLVVVMMIGGYIAVRQVRNPAIGEVMGPAHAKAVEFQRTLQNAVQGFKELQLSWRKRYSLHDHLTEVTEQARVLKLEANLVTVFDHLFGGAALFLLLMAVVFLRPVVLPHSSETTHQIVATVLYILGPADTVTQGLSKMGAIEVGIGHLYALEAQLDAAIETHHRQPVEPLRGFKDIRMEQVRMRYLDTDGTALFSSGPHDLRLTSGETIFLVGGNGAGKSTLLKLLTGLYAPLEGGLQLDRRPVDAAMRPAYRELFSIVFTDFHLFGRLYGREDLDPVEVQRWLTVMSLEPKTRFEDGRFTQTSLSTGQRKRLAFIVAVLRNKPVCILDEVAADQDPAFRQRFYRELLPDLRARGTTVLVVSHDDAYFDCAHRLIRLQDDRVVA